MKIWKLVLPVAAVLMLVGQAAAQSKDERRAEALETREAEITRRMFEAEKAMAQAARQIAELTSARLPQLQRIERRFELFGNARPRLGVTIGGDDDGPVEGVHVLGVTPGSAASDAGLRAGDIITSINDESLSASEAEEATRRLLDFMEGVEAGDKLEIEYLRDGKVGRVEVEPRPVDRLVFAFSGDGRGFRMPEMPDVHVAPGIVEGLHNRFVFNWTSGGWGDMELVELNAGLGHYFGTDSGLLVVSVPESNSLKLQDGDVIQKIDGRVPGSVRHAMRILSSYRAGEMLKLEIMRDKKRRTLDVEMPDNHSSSVYPPMPPLPHPTAVPLAPRSDATIEST